MKSPERVTPALVLAVAMVAVLASTAPAHETPAYFHEGTFGAARTDWMRELDSALHLSAGPTHASPTLPTRRDAATWSR